MRHLFLLGIGLSCLSACSQGPSGISWGNANSANSVAAANSSTGGGSTLTLTNSYESQALALIQANCTSCHGTSSGPAGVYNLTSISNLTATGLVVLGSPNQSPLYTAIASGSMPPTGALNSQQQTLIYNWINDKF